MIPRETNKNNLVILLYHGVTESESSGIENYSKKHIRADEFESHMRFISRNNNVLSIYETIEHLKNKRPFPEYSVAVTFDDGFENNYSVALPILNKYAIPATFFLTVGFIGTNKMFWVDELEHAINMACNIRFMFVLGGKKYKINLAQNKGKIEFLNKVKKYLKTLSDDERLSILEEVIALLAPCVQGMRKIHNYRKLSWAQVRTMAHSKFVALGVHSMTHSKLSLADNEKLKSEIEESKNILEGKIGKRVDLFSYPEGQKSDFNDNVINILKQSGYICSPTAMYGWNPLNSDPFHLKRVFVGFMGEKFPLSKDQ